MWAELYHPHLQLLSGHPRAQGCQAHHLKMREAQLNVTQTCTIRGTLMLKKILSVYLKLRFLRGILYFQNLHCQKTSNNQETFALFNVNSVS